MTIKVQCRLKLVSWKRQKHLRLERSYLKRLTESTEESEARLAREILLRRDSSTVVEIMLNNFARQVQEVVSNCYKAVANIKSQ